MRLDLSSISPTITTCVPVINGQFQLNRKRYSIRCPNGWQMIRIEGKEATLLGETESPPMTSTRVRGYTFGNKLVYKSFDQAKRLGLPALQCDLFFNNADSFSSVSSVIWEDGRLYFEAFDYGDFQVLPVQEIYLQEETSILHLKGVTPELRACFLFHSIELEKQKAFLALKTKEAEERAFFNSIPGRLKLTFERAGAKVLKYSVSGNRIIVDWTMEGSEYEYNSVIDVNTWKILEAGICMSGDDKRHNITSLVKITQEYEQRDVIHRTRT
jgi:hypothetical protein